MVADDIEGPNGLAFSPDETILYVVASRAQPNRLIRAFDVVGGTRLTNNRVFIDAGPGSPDGFRVDIHGNLWCGWGMGDPALDGVRIFNAAGATDRPYRAAGTVARICASADAGATACSWRRATGCMRCTSTPRVRQAAKQNQRLVASQQRGQAPMQQPDRDAERQHARRRATTPIANRRCATDRSTIRRIARAIHVHGAHTNADATFAIKNVRRDMPAIPATSGTVERSTGMNRHSATLNEP